METAFISNKPGPEGRYPQNLYLVGESAIGKPALRKTPGLIHRVTPIHGESVRGLFIHNDVMYAVCGNGFYSIDPVTWTATLIGHIPETEMGLVRMYGNYTQIIIYDSPKTYIYDIAAGTLTSVSSDYGIGTYQDKYFITPVRGYDYFQISGLADGTSWDVLDRGQASGTADPLVAIAMRGRQLCMIGTESTEWFFNSGNADFPFERIQGSFQATGCMAGSSVADLGTQLFFLDHHGSVVRSDGYAFAPVSTPELERVFAQYTIKHDAIAHGIYWHGHPWYVLAFPSADATWVYDLSADAWFQWSGKIGIEFDHRHRSHAVLEARIQNEPRVFCGDYENGKIYELNADIHLDDQDEIRCERTSPVIYDDGKRITFSRFQLNAKTGIGKEGDAEAPQMMLRYSNDDGNTWSNEKWQSMGKIGQYNRRAVWRQLGSSRRRCFQVRYTEDTALEIYSAFLN